MMKSIKDNILKGKRILFFSPAFFGYEIKIKDKLIELGAKVDFFDERSVSKKWQKALLKVNPNIFYKDTEKYYFQILETNKTKRYDFIFFIKCDMPTRKVLKEYRKTFYNAKFILYLYDSLKNIPNINKKLECFDIIQSFDKFDCERNGELNFRPLFYCDEYKRDIQKNKNYLYDLCFIGTIHSDRYKILQNIKNQAIENNLKIYMYPYLQSRFIYYFYKLTKKEFRKTSITDFKFDPLDAKEIACIVENSNVIIDIQHPKQTGLTMRTIEMIGLKKKLITTNKDIINYDFYNSNNIFICKRNNFKMDKAFFETQYEDSSEEIYEKYSLHGWLLEIFRDFL